MDHSQSLLSRCANGLSFLDGAFLLIEVLLDFIAVLHEDVEEVFALFLHVFLVPVNEYGPHDQLVKSVEVFGAALVNMHVPGGAFALLLVGVLEQTVAAFAVAQVHTFVE